VDKVDILEGNTLNFMDLLDWMIKARQKELVLVIHGFPSGTGLDVPLNPEKANCTGSNLQLLMDLEDSGKPPTDRQLAQLGGKQKSVDQLIKRMRQVRAIGITKIESRSCDLGRQPAVLKQFAKFFGAASMGAPTMENIFGISPVSIQALDKIPSKFDHDWTRFSFPDEEHPKVINFLMLNVDTGWPDAGTMFAASKADLEAFIHKHINPDGKASDSVAIHALWKEPPPDHALDKATPILPLDPDYAPNIVSA